MTDFTYKPKPAIDFMKLMRHIKEKYGFNYRDMAGKYSKKGQEHRFNLIYNWLNENGYADKHHVLDKPEGSKEDWPKDSPEIALRIEINTKMRPYIEKLELPYQDVWHYMLENDFCEFRRGGYNYLSFECLEDEDTPDYVKTVYKAILEEVKDHPAYDGEVVNFYVDW